MHLDILHSLNTERAARRAAVVVTDIATGAQRFVAAADVAGDPLREVLEAHLRSGKSGVEETAQGRVFLTVYVPPATAERHHRSNFVAESWAELKKVEWPSQRQVITGTTVVLIACAVVGTYLYLNDIVWKHVVQNFLVK